MCMNRIVLLCFLILTVAATAAPVIDPIPNVTVPAGKSLIIPITATATNGRALTYTVTASTNALAVVLHTNNPFWKLNIAQAAATNAPGAFATPYRGGLVTVTNMGDMTFMLFPEYAPHTVNVFQGLTASGFYSSNTIFHRVVAGFVDQGGDPLTNGQGVLSYKYDDEFHPQAIFSGNGQLALANPAKKDADGPQFFVTVGPQRFLDFGYTLFGQLLRGFNLLTNINNTATNAVSRPLADIIITQASLVPNLTDTVLTLTATNVAGVTSTVTIIADDGAGGRATNTFTATTATDASSNGQPIQYGGSMTNLVGPANVPLTNTLAALQLDGQALYWFPYYGDTASQTNGAISGYYGANVLQNLTYNVTNLQGQLQIIVTPATNYTGPVSLVFEVSPNYQWNLYKQYGLALPAYDQQAYTFVFGDTPINASPATLVPQAPGAFTNLLLATFTNGVVSSAVTNFTASINWGDNAITAGVITTNAAKFKQVLGGHTYTNSGDYPVYITLTSTLGVTAVVSNTITVMPPVKLVRTGTNNVLSWPAWAYGYQVLTSANPAATNWTAVTNFSTLVGFQNVVSNSGAPAKGFFRLKK